MGSLKAAAIGAAVASFVCLSAVALAGSGIGGVFNLGQTNKVNAKSTLTGSAAAPELSVSNTSTDPAATALNLWTPAGRPPLTVNSSTKVANLNADRLDGLSSTSFLPYAKLNTLQDGACSNTHGLAGTFDIEFGRSDAGTGWNVPSLFCLTRDKFEPNETSATPKKLGLSALFNQGATIYPSGDQDWWSLGCVAGTNCGILVTQAGGTGPITCDGSIDGTPFTGCYVTPNNGQKTLLHVSAANGAIAAYNICTTNFTQFNCQPPSP